MSETEKYGTYLIGTFTKDSFLAWANKTGYRISDKLMDFLSKLDNADTFKVSLAAAEGSDKPVLTIDAGQHGTFSDKTTWDELSRVLAGEAYELRGLTGNQITQFLRKHGVWDDFKSRFSKAAKILESNPNKVFDLSKSGKVTLDQQRTVFSALDSFMRGREDVFKDVSTSIIGGQK